MFINKINTIYAVLGFMLFFLFGINEHFFEPEYFFTFLAMFIPFIGFVVVVVEATRCPKRMLNNWMLFIVVAVYSVLMIRGMQSFSYFMDGDYFLFSKVDALLYHGHAMHMKDLSYADGVKYLASFWGFDDWGTPLWITTAFKVYPSQITLGIMNAILNGITAVNIFVTAKRFMPVRYAFLAALTTSLASYTFVRGSQVTKEPAFVFVTVLAFRTYYDYIYSRSLKNLILMCLTGVLTLFFRIPVFFILVLSYVIPEVLKKVNKVVAMAVIAVVAILLVSTSLFEGVFESYLRGGDVDAILATKQEFSAGGGIVNHLADPLAALIGPFPGIAPDLRTTTNLYSAGLLNRVLLAFPFLIGTYYIIRREKYELYPLIMFFFMNALGLIVTIKGLETRLSAPHFPMMYIIAYWGIALVDWQKIKFNRDLISERQYNIYVFAVIGICFLWNIRTMFMS